MNELTSVTVGTLDSVTWTPGLARGILQVARADGSITQLETGRTDLPLSAESALNIIREANSLIGRRVTVTSTRKVLRPGAYADTVASIEELGLVAADAAAQPVPTNTPITGVLKTTSLGLTVEGDDGTILSLLSFGGCLLSNLGQLTGKRGTVTVTVSELP